MIWIFERDGNVLRATLRRRGHPCEPRGCFGRPSIRASRTTCSCRTEHAVRRAACSWPPSLPRTGRTCANPESRSAESICRRGLGPPLCFRFRSVNPWWRISPHVIRHNAKAGRRNAEPIAGGLVRALRQSPAVTLPRLVPDNLAAVERSQQHLPNTAGGPCGGPCPVASAGRVPLLRSASL